MATRERFAGIGRSIGDIMKTRVVTCSPDDSIRQLVQLLPREGISGAPVLDPHGRVVGVVSATDVVRFAAQEREVPSGQPTWSAAVLPEEVSGDDDLSGFGELSSYFVDPEALAGFGFGAGEEPVAAGLDGQTVREIMTPIAFSVRPDDSVDELVHLLLRGRIHRALVVEDGRLRGIVTPFDVLAADYGVPA